MSKEDFEKPVSKNPKGSSKKKWSHSRIVKIPSLDWKLNKQGDYTFKSVLKIAPLIYSIEPSSSIQFTAFEEKIIENYRGAFFELRIGSIRTKENEHSRGIDRFKIQQELEDLRDVRHDQLIDLELKPAIKITNTDRTNIKRLRKLIDRFEKMIREIDRVEAIRPPLVVSSQKILLEAIALYYIYSNKPMPTDQTGAVKIVKEYGHASGQNFLTI